MENLAENQELTFRTIAMPSDNNPAGDIFGGWLMSQMDLAAFVRSSEISQGRTVTVAVNQMVFSRPVKVGDTVCIYTRPMKIGRSSISLEVEVWRRQGIGPREKVTEGVFTMVAVDAEGKSRKIEAVI